MWNAGTIPFVLVAILVATGPVIYMTHHSFKHGHVASLPDGVTPPAADPAQFGWSVCPECKAVITDHSLHTEVAHQLVPAG